MGWADKFTFINDKTLATLSKITVFLICLRYITFEVRGDTKFFLSVHMFKLSFLCKQTWHKRKYFPSLSFCFDLVAPSVIARTMFGLECNSRWSVLSCIVQVCSRVRSNERHFNVAGRAVSV